MTVHITASMETLPVYLRTVTLSMGTLIVPVGTLQSLLNRDTVYGNPDSPY
jgi:hypothetical protein